MDKEDGVMSVFDDDDDTEEDNDDENEGVTADVVDGVDAVVGGMKMDKSCIGGGTALADFDDVRIVPILKSTPDPEADSGMDINVLALLLPALTDDNGDPPLPSDLDKDGVEINIVSSSSSGTILIPTTLAKSLADNSSDVMVNV